MGPQIILAMNTTALLCSGQPNRRYIVVAVPALALCDGTYRRRQCSRSSGVFAPPQRSPSVLFAPPQQRLPRNNNGACSTAALLFFLHTMCAPISNGYIHTRTPCSVSQQRSSRSINRFAALQSSTAIATIETHSDTDDDRHTIERHAVPQQ
jgi:hypothetical protein